MGNLARVALFAVLSLGVAFACGASLAMAQSTTEETTAQYTKEQTTAPSTQEQTAAQSGAQKSKKGKHGKKGKKSKKGKKGVVPLKFCKLMSR